MTSITLKVNGAEIRASVAGTLTSGMVGIPVTIEYDEAWEGLTKNLVCRCSKSGFDDEEYRSILNVGNTSVVAHEVMQAGKHLWLGVEGYNADGTLVIPTTWAMCGVIQRGANTGDDFSADPTLPIWGQLQAKIEQIECGNIPPDQLEEIRACAGAAARAEENAAAASRLAADHADAARANGEAAQTYMENARTSATSAANMANDAFRYQTAAEAAAERAEDAAGSSQHLSWMYVTVELEDEIPCTGITLDKSALTFTGTGQQTIVATVTPADTTDTLTWASSKPSVATVSNGVVTAYANGSATITATCGEHSATCAVEVSGVSSTVAVTGITLDKATATVQTGFTITLTATVKPDNATNKTVLWSSDDETVATVENGVVTGISESTASIGAMTADGGFSAVCNVTVAAASHYRNLFDKDTMVTADEGITGNGTIGSYNWGLARVPVKENTEYSIKMCADRPAGDTGTGSEEWRYYEASAAGSFGFADSTGNTLISRLALTTSQSNFDNGTNGANALTADYAHNKSDLNRMGWATFTTPAGCAYLLFNTTLKNNADKIQLEEGGTIHNYYLPYNGGDA